MKKVLFFLIFTLVFKSNSQNLSSTVLLSSTLNETSGLVHLGSKLITHTDSGGASELYEVNKVTGVVDRTVTITNATNVDWEDITFDDTYIYVGDIGNNNGIREDLKVYRVLRSDFETSTSVIAEVIAYSYDDQPAIDSGSPQPNNNNFDAEALIAYNNKLYVFTKNWVDKKTNIYELSKTPGSYSINRVDTIDVAGLITGATIHNNVLLLSGYSKFLAPFLYESRDFNNAVFSGGTLSKTPLSLPSGQSTQIEGIAFLNETNFYVSAEKDPFNRLASLYSFGIDNTTLSNSSTGVKLIENGIERIDRDHILINSDKQIPFKIYSTKGNLLLEGRTRQKTAISSIKNQIAIVVVGSSSFKYVF